MSLELPLGPGSLLADEASDRTVLDLPGHRPVRALERIAILTPLAVMAGRRTLEPISVPTVKLDPAGRPWRNPSGRAPYNNSKGREHEAS
jgi:hypothetical protein